MKLTTPLDLAHLPGDPPSPIDGQVWYNDGLQRARKRQAGVTSDLDTTAGGSDPLPMIAARHLIMN
jgi:hypothetical protein